MTEVSFYHLQGEPLERALPRLLEKAYERGMRTLVRLKSEALLGQLDNALWAYSPASFLPHAIEGGELPSEDQPVLLTLATDGNGNSATVLTLLEDCAASDIADYDRCLYMFNGDDEVSLSAARERWKNFKAEGIDVAYWQQGPNGWQKKA